MDNQALAMMDSEEESMEQSKEMSIEDLKTLIENELMNAIGGQNSQLAQDRARALDYYFNRPRGDEVTGRSKVQSSDVMDVIEWVLPDIIEAFTSNDDAVAFQPYGEYDIDQARLESQYINHIFQTEAGGYLTLYSFFKDALLQKNGIVKTYYEKKTQTRYEEYEGLTSTELQQVLDTTGKEFEIEPYQHSKEEVPITAFPEEIRSKLYGIPEVQQQIQQIQQELKSNVMIAINELGYNDPSQMPPELSMNLQQQSAQVFQEAMQEIQIPLYNVKVKVKSTIGKTVCMPVPPEEFRLNSDHASIDLTDARFTCHESWNMTASDLIEMGYPEEIIEKLPAIDQSHNTEANSRRYGALNEVLIAGMTDATKKIHFCDIYMKVDFDGDGIAELRHIHYAGDREILENEYADENPFSTASPIMVPHRWIGVSLYDRVKQIQDIGTAVWRNLLDNFYRANNNRTIVVENQVNMDDLLNPRPSGAVRARNIDAVKPFPYTPIGAEGYQILESLSRARMERSGVGPEMMAEGMVIDNDTSHGVERLMSAKEKLVGMVIKNLGEVGIADMFLKMHNCSIKHQSKIKEVEINGQWRKFNPKEWRYRTKPRIKVGLGAGDKIKHSAVVTKVLANHQLLASTGMNNILFDYVSSYNALCDEARFAGIRHPEMYYKDPRSPEAKQAIEAMMKQAQQPSETDKVLMLEKQVNDLQGQIKVMKHNQDYTIDLDEQKRKWQKDRNDLLMRRAEIEVQLKAIDQNEGGSDAD